MVKVPPLAAHLLMRFRQQCNRFPTAVAAFLATRDPALGGFQRTLRLVIPAGMEDARAVGQSGKGFDSKVYPRLLPGRWQGLCWHISARDTGIPPISLTADRDRLRCTFQRTRPAHRDVPDLGEDKKAIIQPRPAMLAHLRIGEGVVAVPALEAGIAGRLPFAEAAEERLEGQVYAQHDILQDLGVDLGILWHSLLDAGQFGLLLIVTGGDTAHPPRLTPFPDGGIVDVTAEHQGTFKQPLLFRRGFEFVLEGFADALLFHIIELFCPIGAKAPSSGTFVALSGHPTFIPIATKARGPQPDFR
jgi:hypothetical protein